MDRLKKLSVRPLKHFLRHYKTSLLGIGAAAANLAANGMQPRSIAFSTVAAVLGLFARDPQRPTSAQ